MFLFLMMPIRGGALRHAVIGNDVVRNHEVPGRNWQTDNCFTLNMGGFPLPSGPLTHELVTKADYFKHVKSLGYDESLRVVQKGTVEKFDECWGNMKNTFFVFVGDCMGRQSFRAFSRISSEGDRVLKENKTITPAEDEMLEILSLDQKKSAELSVPKQYVVKGNSAYVQWQEGNIDEFIQRCQQLFDESGLDPSHDDVVIWANFAIHTYFFGSTGDFGVSQDRRLKLQELITRLRQSFPGARIAWMTANHLDLRIMESPPEKHDVRYFKQAGVKPKTIGTVAIDEDIMQALNVSIVPRYQVSKKYAGLQCDGIHNDPHNETGADSWGCPGYPAIEELILRAGIAAMCSPGEFPICAPSEGPPQ
jgi:hypothetical protein